MDIFSFFPFALFAFIGVLLILVAFFGNEPGIAIIGIFSILVGLCLSPFLPAVVDEQATNATPSPAVPIPCLSSYGWSCTYLNQSDTSAGFVCLPKNTQGAGP